MSGKRSWLYRSLLAAPVLAFVPACGDPFPAKPVIQYGDFGTEVYAFLHDEFLWSGSPAEGASRASAFAQHQTDVVWALNALTQGKVHDGMLPLLEELLPLYDNRPDGKPGALPVMSRDLADILAELVQDDLALEALARFGTAPEANPNAITHLLGTMARNPIELLDRLVDLTLDLEPELTELFRYLYRELPTLEEGYIVRSDQKTFLQRLLDVTIDATTEPIGPPVYSARIDGRGAPVVNRLPSGQFPSPFVDNDGDGAVDVDAYSRALDQDGLVIDLPTFAWTPTALETRDRLGRAIVDTTLVYDYFDLRQTVIAYLMRDGRKLLADGVHFDLFTALDALLGGRVTREDEDGSYTGFFVEGSPLVDLVHVGNELRRYDHLVPLIAALEQLTLQREPLFRQIFFDVAKVRAIFEDAPSLTEGNALFEDIHPTLARLAKAGGLRELFRAAHEAGTDGMWRTMATMMRYSDLALPFDMSLLEIPADVDALSFQAPTPWEVPDTDDSQRSWLQKAAYLIADTKQAPAYMKLFDIVEIQEIAITLDMAHLYVTAIADRATLDLSPAFLNDAAVALAPEFDDIYLQAEELNLYMNHDQTATGNPVGRQGVQVRKLYGPALLALQTSGNLDALRPWVTRLVDRHLTDEFVNLFDTLAHHYSEVKSTVNGFVSEGTGFRKLEPWLVRVFEETDLGEHFLALAAWADTATYVSGGQTYNVADELDRFLGWMLDPEAGMTLRNGQTTVPSRRGGVIAKPSRLEVLLDAFDRIDAALSAEPAARAAWDNIDLLGLFLDLDVNGELMNRHALEVTVKLLPVLADEVAQAVSEPDWNESLDTLVPDVEDLMGSRGFTALVDAMRRIKDTPRHKALVDELLTANLVEDPAAAGQDLMGAGLGVLATVGQIRLPIDAGTRLLRFVGKLLDPAKRRVMNQMETLRDMRAFDGDRVTSELAVNLFVEPEVGHTPIDALLDALKSGLRPVPGAPDPYDPADLKVVFQKMADWLRDDQKGMEQMYQVIQTR